MTNQTDTVDPATGEILETNTYGVSNDIESCGYSDEELITVKVRSQQAVKDALDLDGKVDQELMRRAEDRGATTIYGKGMNYVIETKNETDWAKMPPVLEFLTPEEKAEAFKPEHTVTIPAVPEHKETVLAKWAVKGTVMKLLRRHGDQAVAAADLATFPGVKKGKLVDA